MRKLLRPPGIFVVLAAVALAIALVVAQLPGSDSGTSLGLSELEQKVGAGQVATAKIADKDHVVSGALQDGTKYRTTFPTEYGATLTKELVDANVVVKVDSQKSSPVAGLLLTLLPTLLIVGVLVWFLTSAQGGRGVMQFGRSRAKKWKAEGPLVTFADVAGIDEAVEELVEVKEFLAEPARFEAVGARIPKGVLLFGPPGTGKTLLARAVAGEAGVPFFSISGSDFVEMFVGVGASRVRDLFNQAKSQAPAIVFVDEIDAVGRHRGAGLGGGHDEREQTLNQLLVEMDGFDPTKGVILIAGTNRPDILDPALLRPGRFDRHIAVDPPDLQGRKAILAVHAKGKPIDPGVDLALLARRTPGFTGADLANVLNEAALLAARRGAKTVVGADIEAAVERVMAGPEKKARVMSEREKRVVAYHEAGHALVGHVLPHGDPIHKVSIVSRGRALGWTLALPEEDRILHTRSELLDTLAMLLGGRGSELLVFGDPTTGAQNDIERATQIARSMVTQWGMSDILGPVQFGQADGDVFVGRDGTNTRDYSESMATRIDAEVTRLVEEAQTRARTILEAERPALDRLAAALVERETLAEDELTDIFVTVSGAGLASVQGSAEAPA
ncbi:MAG TPA: ATP-dependent zinc metalloprotease FtsH [Acidimicrobiales bacterium]